MFSWRQTAKNATSMQGERSQAFGQVLDCARKGEKEALSTLYRHFLPGVFGYIAARIPDRSTAEDLTSDVFVKMVEGIQKVRASNEARFAAWLFQVARLTVAGYYRKQKQEPALVTFEAENWEGEAALANHPDSDPVRRAEAREDWCAVVQAINTLTEDQRQVLIGRLILGYNVAMVARMIGKQANTVKVLQFRALRNLHYYFEKHHIQLETLALRQVRKQEEAP